MNDLRRERGQRSRQLILAAAVDTASLDGLEAVSFGAMAKATGLSKAGVQALYTDKLELQLATTGHAREAFIAAVVAPALQTPRGLARLRELIGRWLEYAERPLFTGGCFWAANLPHYDSHPGAVRDALVGQQNDWRDLLAAELHKAVELGELSGVDPEPAALQIDAVLSALNIALRAGDVRGARSARQSLAAITG